jgi:putative ABC transport system ATP-binding protein
VIGRLVTPPSTFFSGFNVNDCFDMPLVLLNRVCKSYRLGNTVVPALRDVSLRIDRGEFVAVVGPSGSGKSTLLNLVGLIDEPTTGRIHFNGQDADRLSDNQKSHVRNMTVGFVFQQFNLIPVLSALENVLLPLQIMGQPYAQSRSRALHRLDQMGLLDLSQRRPDKLSGGQRQRTAIARALVADPGLIIADEPTANLDSETALSILKLMRQLNRNEGTTFVFATHDRRLLSDVSRQIHMADGRLDEEYLA